MSDEKDLRERIADAISQADVGFSMNLIRLVDGVRTYSLTYSDGEYLEFADDETDDFDAQERLYAHVSARKRQRQADAVLAALPRRADLLEAKEAEIDQLRKALEGVLNAETFDMHVGYDNSPGGGNFVYADVIRTDSDEFRAARRALSPAHKGI